MAIDKTEIAVIGAGPGGYPAAFLAADHGKKVTLIEADPTPGGVCLNRGCIPSKTLLHFAKLIHETREARDFGLEFGEPNINLQALREWKNKVIANLTSGISNLCKARGVELVQGRATFESSTRLKVETPQGVQSLEFEHAILATGSRPSIPPMLTVKDPRIMDSTAALELKEIPKTLLVVGGGYIGLEMGTVYAALGSKVTVVEFLDGLLMGVDRDLVRPLQQRLVKEFAAIYLKSKVVHLSPGQSGIEVTFEGEIPEKKQTFDRILIATGRRPNTENLGLENTDVTLTPKGFVQVDKTLRTTDPHISAIGDVAGEPMLAHKATREARVAVEVLIGQPSVFDNVAIPAVVFTDPEIAWVGLTEMQAQVEKRDISVVRFPWAASGRAQTLGRTEGVTKIIFDTLTERVLGVGIVGVGAGELIAEGALAVEMAAVAHDVAATIHAHPTLAETLMESGELLHGLATHIARKNSKKTKK